MIIRNKLLTQFSFKKSLTLAILALAFGWLGSSMQAADANVAGTWKASFATPDGQTIESTLKLKQEGDKLSGTVLGRNGNEYRLDEVKLTDDQLTIKATRERNGEKVTMKVVATLNGDNLKGKLESNWGGTDRKVDWEAKRATETAVSATGNWKYTLTLESGDIMNLVLNLNQEGEKVTGKVKVGDFEAPITEGKVVGEAISFAIPVDANGTKFTSTYKGALSGDAIKGRIHSDWNGEDHNYDWNAAREKAGATGTWNWVLVTASGDSIDLSLKLKQDGDKLAGVVVLGDNETPIAEGLIKDNQISLKVTREKDGKTQTAKFNGKLEGDTIKGKIDSDWSGENHIYDWNAKRAG
jgi:hypothetical protein